jgi:hypothetical protein
MATQDYAGGELLLLSSLSRARNSKISVLFDSSSLKQLGRHSHAPSAKLSDYLLGTPATSCRLRGKGGVAEERANVLAIYGDVG